MEYHYVWKNSSSEELGMSELTAAIPELPNVESEEKVELLDCNNDPGVYSTKVFLGGLPQDVDEEDLRACFGGFGNMIVDWPGKSRSTYLFPPKGFAFLLYESEVSVHNLLASCWQSGSKLFFPVSSLSNRNKLVQVRAWKIADATAIVDKRFYCKQQFAVFVGGVPRPVTAAALANALSSKFGKVGYVEIGLDNKTKYPNGTAIVLFSNVGSYYSALLQKHAVITFSEHSCKTIEFKPLMMKQGPTGMLPFAPLYPPVPDLDNLWFAKNTIIQNNVS